MVMGVFQVAQGLPGALWMMPHPPADAVQDRLDACKALGIDTVLSMLPPDEADDLGLRDEEKLCARCGIDFLNHPIDDFALPLMAPFRDLIRDLDAKLHEGRGVVVHCRAGIGRSGMVVAAVLTASGMDAVAALDHVSAARGAPVPDTAEQRAFVLGFTPKG